MNFLADESCSGLVVRALREAGHDVSAIAETSPGITDDQVLEIALKENRILITEDLDFGNLVHVSGRPSVGVILMRFHARARPAKPATMVQAVARLGSRLRNAFTIVEPGRVRISETLLP